jgi:hypothetical protein
VGVKAQFWMSAWELYGFARQYAGLAVQPGLRFMPLRFEVRQLDCAGGCWHGI